MRDPEDDSDLDRSYRAAVGLMGGAEDRARAQGRRRAVLDAVDACAAPVTARGEPPATAQVLDWQRPAAWWSGALAACVMAGSALVVVHMLDEPGADAPSKVADAAWRRASPGVEPQTPTVAAPTLNAPAAAHKPAAAAKPTGQVAAAHAPPAGQAVPPGSATRELELARPSDELAKASSDARLDANATPPRQAVVAAPPAPARAEAPPPPAALPPPMATPAPVAEGDRLAPQRAARAAAAAPRSDLLAAVMAGHVDAARAILKHAGPDSSKDADGRTALAWAVLGSDAEMVVLLLERGADRLAQDRFGQTPLGYAAAAANPAVLKAFGLR